VSALLAAVILVAGAISIWYLWIGAPAPPG
jgi:hypothetical protein